MKLKIEYNHLLNLPEFCYFLGLLYADGHISHTHRAYVVKISTTEDNLDYFEDIFGAFCEFSTYHQQRAGWKASTVFSFGNKEFYNFLVYIGLDNKEKNAHHIIDKITNKECRRLFFTGYFDGDGCVYYNPKQHLRQASITSSVNQDWTFMINLCNDLNIKNYNITTTITKRGHKSSNFRICNKAEFGVFLSHVYDSERYGFQRKKDRFKEAMRTCRSELRFNPGLRPIKQVIVNNYS